MPLREWTELLILITATIWIIYDFYVYFKGGTGVTISWTIFRWSRMVPAIIFIAGLLCGHFFFAMDIPDDYCSSDVSVSK